MKFVAPQTMSATSATIIRYALALPINCLYLSEGLRHFNSSWWPLAKMMVIGPWSQECLVSANGSEEIPDKNTTIAYENATITLDKGCLDVESEEYAMKQTVMKTLMAVVLVGGILAVVSNMVVLFFGLKKKVFPAPILTLAFNDLLNGLLGTPFVMAIYYFSE